MSHLALVTASRLAAAHPDASLPCPVCGASLRASNLDGHVAKVHHTSAGPASSPNDPLVLVGVDGRIARVLAVPVALWVLVVGAVAVLGASLDDRLGIALAALIVVAFVPLVLALVGLFRARLVLEGDEIRLRYALGLLEARARLPAAIEVGPRIERRSVPGISGDLAEDVRAGVYLRLGDALTIGARKGTGFRAHWSPDAWRSGPARRRCDVTLDRLSMIALEYHLASRTALRPR